MTINSSMIEYKSNGHKTPGYLARPADDGKYPGVIVLQEWWGINEHIKDVTERFAQARYVALAPDLYHGKATAEPDEARKLAMALNRDAAIQEISAAGEHLLNNVGVVGEKIGIVGWCMGGGLALSTATEYAKLGAVVSFYGRPLDARDTPKLNAPVLGLYGELDQGIPASMVRDFETELNQNHIPNQINIYSDAQHAFFNDTRAQAYNPQAAEDAWTKTLAWFEKYIG